MEEAFDLSFDRLLMMMINTISTINNIQGKYKILTLRHSHKNSNRKEAKPVFHNFLSWPPSIAHTLSYQIVLYIVLNRPVPKADNLPPSCAVVTKSGSLNFLEPSGPVQACNGAVLPLPLP